MVLAKGATTDWYGGKGRVPIEAAAEKEEYLKRRLDQQVADENRWGSAPAIQRGLPPCKRVNRRWWG